MLPILIIIVMINCISQIFKLIDIVSKNDVSLLNIFLGIIFCLAYFNYGISTNFIIGTLTGLMASALFDAIKAIFCKIITLNL